MRSRERTEPPMYPAQNRLFQDSGVGSRIFFLRSTSSTGYDSSMQNPRHLLKFSGLRLALYKQPHLVQFRVMALSDVKRGALHCTIMFVNIILEFDIVPMSTITLLVFQGLDFFIYFDMLIRVKPRQ